MLFNLFKKFFTKEIENLKAIAASNAVDEHCKEEIKKRGEFKRIEADIWMKKPIIVISNEWNEPIVGELLRLENFNNGSFGYIYMDYITNREFFSLVSPLAFSEQKMKILGKLNPDEYCCLMYEGRSHFGEFRKHPTYGKVDEFDKEFTNYDNWIVQLKKNGFYEKFGVFLKDEEESAKIHLAGMVEKYGKFNY